MLVTLPFVLLLLGLLPLRRIFVSLKLLSTLNCFEIMALLSIGRNFCVVTYWRNVNRRPSLCRSIRPACGWRTW